MAKKNKPNGHDILRVFIGTSPEGEDVEACAALEYSLRSRASVPIEIELLRLSGDPASPCYSNAKAETGWQTEQWRTPWTALRWAIPEICGWKGRAIYFDCPTIVLGDIAELATAPIPEGAFVLLRRSGSFLQTGCAVFDCAVAKKWLPSIKAMQADVGAHQAAGVMLEQAPDLVGPLPSQWGLTDHEFSSKADIQGGSVHFVSPLTQPHAPRALSRLAREHRHHWHSGVRLPHYCTRLIELFEVEYKGAVEAGYGAYYLSHEEEEPRPSALNWRIGATAHGG